MKISEKEIKAFLGALEKRRLLLNKTIGTYTHVASVAYEFRKEENKIIDIQDDIEELSRLSEINNMHLKKDEL